jgi:hypothetical protein
VIIKDKKSPSLVADTGGVGNLRDDLPIIFNNILGTSCRGYNMPHRGKSDRTAA